jgi:hypothetical protein
VLHQDYVLADCVRLSIADVVTEWTPDEVYTLIHDNLMDDALIGPETIIRIGDDPTFRYTSGVTTYVGYSNGHAVWFNPVVYLEADPGRCQFTKACPSYIQGTAPDDTIAHELGHVWTEHYLYLAHDSRWATYQAFRGLTDPPSGPLGAREPFEVSAEDYRLCFGTDRAKVRPFAWAGYPPTDQIPGLCAWFLSDWKVA